MEDKTIGTLPKPQHEAARTILAAARRMKRLLDDLLNFARMESGHFQLRSSKLASAEPVTVAPAEPGAPISYERHGVRSRDSRFRYGHWHSTRGYSQAILQFILE
ncbi:MAG: hypothetical protein HY692_03350 [Cyanobacteria bacterium NC_groundwater_1444_Ag_S-0.65um_54_12]|nr:hypothetical protein [Cyanobacteria bacterium NC_groundwater_1444_Ag_S-0.65um_54_12]